MFFLKSGLIKGIEAKKGLHSNSKTQNVPLVYINIITNVDKSRKFPLGILRSVSNVFLCDDNIKQNIFLVSLQVISVHHPGLECREFPLIFRPAVTYRNNEDKLRRGRER